MPQDNETLIRQAKLVLDFNWTGEYTKPGPRLYPHQWSWDSAFIAIGYSRYDQDRATKELSHLFESQWANGLLPQIVFNPEFDRYFPGIDFWRADRSLHAPAIARPQASPSRRSTPPPRSACTSPPRTPRRRRRSSSGYCSDSPLGTTISTGRETLSAKAWFTHVIPGRAEWTTPRCGIRSCSASSSDPSRFPL
jgi:hypothetical protein